MHMRWIAATLAAVVTVSPAAADARGAAALKAAFNKMYAAKTMTATITGELRRPAAPAPVRFNGTFAAMKPNFMRLEMKGPAMPIFISDGKYYYNWVLGQPRYSREPVSARPREFAGIWEGEIDAFFGGSAKVDQMNPTLKGSEKLQGVDCDLVQATLHNPERTVVYAIGKADRIIRRAVITIPLTGRGRRAPSEPGGPKAAPGMGGSAQVQINQLSDVRFNVPKSPADFQFHPPKNVTPLPPRRQDIITLRPEQGRVARG